MSVPDAVPAHSAQVRRAPAQLVEAPTQAQALQLDTSSKHPRGKMEVMAMMQQRASPASSRDDKGVPLGRALRAGILQEEEDMWSSKVQDQDPPVVPPGYAAFDYVSALPMSVL